MTLHYIHAVQRRAGWGAVIGGLLWLVKGSAILLAGIQPPYLFEAAPFFLGIGLWGLYFQMDRSERGRLAGAGAILALAAAVSALVQLWAELFAPQLVPQEDTVTLVTPFVAHHRPPTALVTPVHSGGLSGSDDLVHLLGRRERETAAGDRLLEVPVVLLGVAWMWLGALVLRIRSQ